MNRNSIMQRDRAWGDLVQESMRADNMQDNINILFRMARFLYDEKNYRECVFKSAIARFYAVKFTNAVSESYFQYIFARIFSGKDKSEINPYPLNKYYEMDALKKSGFERLKSRIEKLYLEKNQSIDDFIRKTRALLEAN